MAESEKAFPPLDNHFICETKCIYHYLTLGNIQFPCIRESIRKNKNYHHFHKMFLNTKVGIMGMLLALHPAAWCHIAR